MRKLIYHIVVFSLFLSCGLLDQQAVAQQSSAKRDSVESRQSAVDASISIDPNKLVEILQKQPGLVYAVKKLLADAALQEGRLLDDNSFPDSTLYYLIQSDENIRAMVTAELIKRKYIQVNPTEQETTNEILRQRQRQSELAKTARDHDQEENPLYSASDPERKIRPSTTCDPSADNAGDRCPLPRITIPTRTTREVNPDTAPLIPIQ